MKSTTIPKIIHYCWFGRNPLPPLALKCIESWRKYLPDYEIKEWNEDNFDITITPYVEEAYHMKKYAFVSDFARFWALYHYGGVYFDTDVELIKPIDDILERGPYMGLEELINGYTYQGLSALPAAGLGMAVYPHFEPLRDMMQYYYCHHFISWRGKPKYKTVVQIVTDILLDRGAEIAPDRISECAGLYLYPDEYFSPAVDVAEDKSVVITTTDNTRSIHHYAGSWVNHNSKRGLPMHWQRFKNLLFRIRVSLKWAFKAKQINF